MFHSALAGLAVGELAVGTENHLMIQALVAAATRLPPSMAEGTTGVHQDS